MTYYPRSWTPARDERFTHLWLAGAPIAELMDEFSLSDGALRAHAVALGLPPRRFAPALSLADFDRLLAEHGPYKDITRTEQVALHRLLPVTLSAPLPHLPPAHYVPRRSLW